MNKSSYNANEKSIPIQIKKILKTAEKISLDGEYSLKQNVFDPFKSSPPNEFMLKLNMRCFLHHKKDVRCDSE